ncbi:MAG: head-tail joining protein [Shimia sp.]
MTAFAAALDALFADAHLACDVVYTAEGGAPALVRAILRRPDDVTNFGEARIWSETTRLDLRLSEVANPRPGDRIEIPGMGPGQASEAFLVQCEPVRDRERLVWTVDLRPA